MAKTTETATTAKEPSFNEGEFMGQKNFTCAHCSRATLDEKAISGIVQICGICGPAAHADDEARRLTATAVRAAEPQDNATGTVNDVE